MSGWRTVRIGDVCDLGTGGTPSSSKPEYYEGGDVPWLVSGDIHRGQIHNCKGRITQLGLENSNARWLPVNSVIIALNGQGRTRGTVALLRMKATCNQSLVSINPRNARELLPEFLFWNLYGRYEEIRRITGDDGNERRGLNMPLIRNISFPLPPLEEQRRIVAVLDEAFAAIATATANAEKNLANARELFEQASTELLSQGGSAWEEYLLEDVCSISSKLINPRLNEFIDLPHIGAGNIESRTGELSDVLSAREEGLISGKFLFDPTMVLYSKIRPYLMKACRPNFVGLCSADVYPLAPKNSELDRDFLFHILLSRQFTTYAEAGSARAGMPKVNRYHLFAYRLSLPPIERQRELAKRIDALADGCRDLAECFNRKLKHLVNLKQSLLHLAFTGGLTVVERELVPA